MPPFRIFAVRDAARRDAGVAAATFPLVAVGGEYH
jgi:hypothetical protein